MENVNDPLGLRKLKKDIEIAKLEQSLYSTPEEINEDPSRFIILPQEDSLDLLVSMDTVHLADWPRSQIHLSENGHHMLDLNNLRDFIRLIISGETLYDGNGMKLGKEALNKLKEGLLLSPSNQEWVDAQFAYARKGYNPFKRWIFKTESRAKKFTEKGEDLINLEQASIEPLDKSTLMGGYNFGNSSWTRRVDIDLKSWLEEATLQGMPKKGIKSGDLAYFVPTFPSGNELYEAFDRSTFSGCLLDEVRREAMNKRKGLVTAFGADETGTLNLYCDVTIESHSHSGVRNISRSVRPIRFRE